MHAILGYGQPTVCGITDFARLDHLEAYKVTDRGDGVVPVDMGLLAGVRSLFVDGEHAGLTSNHEVLAAIDELLATGRSERLGHDPGPGSGLGTAQHPGKVSCPGPAADGGAGTEPPAGRG